MQTIRLMTPADHQGIATLFEEMQAHYAVFCPPRETILAGLREMPGGAEMLIAEENGGITGFAAFSAIYPGPGLKPGVFLKELYVSKDYRGKGLGRQIMKALGALALERKLSRIDWTADTDNLSLLSFYDDIGGSRKTGKLFYRLEGQALTDLAT